MSEINFNSTCTEISDYDVQIDVEYYNRDYDYSVLEEPIFDEETTTPTDILFE